MRTPRLAGTAHLVALAGACLLAACGGGGGDPGVDPDAGEPDPIMLRGACPLAERLGGFSVEAQEQFSTVSGSVRNGIEPVTVLEEVQREGDCALLRKNNPFCDPPCQAGTTCDFDGTCITQPNKQDVGVVTISGLLAEIVLEPLQPTNDYFTVEMLPNPVFEPGAEIRLTSTAGVYGELSLTGIGGEPLVMLDPQWNVTEGQTLSVGWELPATEARTSVALRLNIDQHGNTPVTLACAFDDDGQGEIPRSVIDALVQFGVSGFPNGTLTRRTADSQQLEDGCVEFTVSTPRPQDVRVSGHTPCNLPSDCPMGQTCDIPNQTCI